MHIIICKYKVTCTYNSSNSKAHPFFVECVQIYDLCMVIMIIIPGYLTQSLYASCIIIVHHLMIKHVDMCVSQFLGESSQSVGLLISSRWNSIS